SQREEDFEFEADTFESDAMQRGNDLEPFAREYLNKYTGLEFKQTGWLQSEENELLGISPDGITDCNRFSCEIKCLG
ncbi:YqaJ viral recombinase family protein, partial [Listeria monocytogenes]|uniref:YqaJ viral recombinase family protein n=1 Tax=Listeria monocytogenes TaxID=1639 RepID=UPI002FDC518E